jgi:dipeptidyl-peptidase-4
MVDYYSERYPQETTFRYPKAGEHNSEIKVGVIDMAAATDGTGAPTDAIQYFDTETWDPELSLEEEIRDPDEYIARMGWTPEIDGRHRVWLFRMNRDQNALDVMYGDPQDASLQTVLEETSDTYIDVFNGKLEFLEDGERFVWTSERTGYQHLHLYRNDGTYLGPITEGRWEVTSFHGLDEERQTAYFTATRDTSIERHLYRADVTMGEHETAATPTKITEAAGWHNVNMSKDLRYYIDTHSSTSTPPTVTLRSADGDALTVLESNDTLKERLARLDLPETEFMTVPAADGTPLNAYMIRPNDFDASREYPVLMYVYGGPGVQTVTNRWGGRRHLWHQYLAEKKDVIVVSVDNRGTGGRGKAFQDVPYRQLGQIEAADQIHAARHLGREAYVDSSRIGIWGWSYGGYMTLLSMLSQEGPSTFAAGISVAPVTDWRLYDTIYTERYMAPPQRNAAGYREGAPLHFADRLGPDQRLLLAHGGFDDNVHFQNSIKLVKAFTEANKQFEFMMYPGRDHSIAGGGVRLHLFQMATDFVEEHLMKQELVQAAAD